MERSMNVARAATPRQLVLNHEDPRLEGRFLWALALTTVVLVAEVVGGLWTGSLALLSDAAHVLMDVVALGLSYVALRMAAREPSDRRSSDRMRALGTRRGGLRERSRTDYSLSRSWAGIDETPYQPDCRVRSTGEVREGITWERQVCRE